jgi:mRNA interferase RelE/StbE
MTPIKIVAETKDTVTVSRQDWARLLAELEDAEDRAAVSSQPARETAEGKEAICQNCLTDEEAKRLVEGESPVRVWRERRGATRLALAAAARVTATCLAGIENGRNLGRAAALSRLARMTRNILGFRSANGGDQPIETPRREAVGRAIGAIKDHFAEHGITAEFPIDVLPDLLPPGPVILDAGAHNGSHTAKFAQTFPAGTILAFEPHPDLFSSLRQVSDRHPNVVAECLAIAETAGMLDFHISSGTSDAASSLLKPKEIRQFHPGNRFEQIITVQAVRLDDYLKDKRIDRVDFFWLDLQGVELPVLRTMGDSLAKTTALWVEVSIREVYEGVTLYGDLRAFLDQAGFSVQFEQLPWPDAGNVLFVNRQWLGSRPAWER